MNVRLILTCLIGLLSISQSLMALRRLPAVAIDAPGYVTCACFDRQGMLWVGTSEGLVKHDGYRSTAYCSNRATPNLLPNDYVRCLAAADSSTLWIGTNDGLARMDLRNGHTKHYHLRRTTQRIVYTLFTARNGQVYAGTDGGLVRYIKRDDRWEDVPLCQFSVKDIAEDRHGHLFLGTWADGLRVRSADGTRVWRIGEAGTNVFSLCFDRSGRLWTGSWHGGINVIDNACDPTKATVTRLAGTDKLGIYRMCTDPLSGSVWACSNKTVAVITPGIHGAAHKVEYLERSGRSDYCGVCTNGRGLVAVPSNWGDVSMWSTGPARLSFFAVDALCPTTAVFTTDDQHILAVSSGSGVCGLEISGQQIHPCTHWNHVDLSTTMPAACYAVRQRTNGDVWIGSYYDGAVIVHKDGRITTWNMQQVPQLIENGIASLYAEADGTMWVGQWSSIARVAPDNKTEVMDLGRLVGNGYKSKVRSIMVDHKHRVWITTFSNGILRMNAAFTSAADAQVRQYDMANHRLPLRDVTACTEDRWHRIWAISMVGGLMRYDERADRFVSVGKRYGIYEDHILGMAADGAGNLWMTTNDHLVCLCQDKKGATRVLRFAYPDEGGSIKPQENSMFLSKNYLYFTSQNGFVRFSPTSLLTTPVQTPPAVTLTGLRIDERQVSELDTALQAEVCAGILPPFVRQVVLPASVSKFAVSFVSLSYAGTSAVRYAYCLEGYDKQRTVCAANSTPEATYENLPTGHYALHIWATDDAGQWHEAPFTLTVVVLPPWWRTWWACLLWLVVAAMVVWLAAKAYQRHIRTLNKLRIANVFTNITHELVTPLAVVSALVDNAKTDLSATSYLSMQTHIERLKRLIRQILEAGKNADHQLRIVVSRGNLSLFVGNICNNMQVLARQKNIRMEYQTDNDFADAYFDPDKLDTVVYNLLSNAIKYTEDGGSIQVALHKTENGHARITIADTGIGIDKKRMRHLYSRFMDGDYRRMKTMGTGIGLSLTRDLVVLHQGTIRCESERGHGTTFTVEIPVDSRAYADKDMPAANASYRPLTREWLDTADSDGMHLPTADNNGPEPNVQTDSAPIILLVEDNAELLRLMEQALDKRYEVLTARNGQQALNIIGRKPLDMVITDVMMPVMDGMELTRRIKDNPDTAPLPVVMLTAKMGKDDRNEAYRIGADEYLTKPFGMDDLQLRINNILANRERIRLKFTQQTNFQVEQQAYSDPDAEFMKKAIACVERHLADSDYARDDFAADMCMSASTLYKKLRALTGQNVSAFVNSIRLKEACRIARTEPNVQISELYARLGYNSPSYFARLFKAEFGMTFTEYQEEQKYGAQANRNEATEP